MDKDLQTRIAEAKARLKAQQAQASTKSDAPARPKRQKLSDAEKALRDAQLKADKEKRAAEKAAKKAEREAAKQNAPPPHTRKVEKAIAALPDLSEHGASLLSDAMTNLSLADVALLAAHLDARYRFTQTERCNSSKPTFEPGDTVVVTASSDPRLLGRTGTVTKLQLIRAYVRLEGDEKDSYFFTSELEQVAEVDESDDEDSDAEATGTDG